MSFPNATPPKSAMLLFLLKTISSCPKHPHSGRRSFIGVTTGVLSPTTSAGFFVFSLSLLTHIFCVSY
uniref:Uncharacterized protein n=1 Tax=Anguilla anguilla TaxID=7936 RepID=A0A0E9WMT5_ANGAN